jgi:hypothetical protein
LSYRVHRGLSFLAAHDDEAPRLAEAHRGRGVGSGQEVVQDVIAYWCRAELADVATLLN